MKRYKQQGFTLIELSIVIVIIALIVGGVLIGRDLIDNTRLRKMITTHEQLSTAINTFKSKYGYLPGDLPQARAQAFGFSTCLNQFLCGNGNGRINSSAIPLLIESRMMHELPLFWRQLKQSGLFDSSVDPSAPLTAIDGYPDPAITTEQEVWRYTPKSPIAGSLLISGQFFGFSPGLVFAKASTIPGTGIIPTASVLTPLQAFYVDSKMDDGVPEKGLVYSYCSTNPLAEEASKSLPCLAGTPNSVGCSFGVGALKYNTGGSQANNINCEMTMAIKGLNG